MNVYRAYILQTAGLCIGALLLVCALVQVRARMGGPTLTVEWDGFGGRINYRDIGHSVNNCLKREGLEPLFREGLLGRSNHKFSGFSCGRLGNPDVIYSFNYEPKKGREFFCLDDNSKNGSKYNIGRHFNGTYVLNDLEFEKTWQDEVVRKDACGFFRDSFAMIAAGKKVHVHCEAGRDRTGTYAALATALVAERVGRLDAQTLSAIECDYRKTRSLKEYKFGRMESFIKSLAKSGGVAAFFQNTCAISLDELSQAADALAKK